MSINTFNINFTPVGSETVEIDQISTGLGAVPIGAFSALVYVEGSDIRFWTSGSDPTSTEGFKVNADEYFSMGSIDQINAFRVVSLTSTNARLQIQYYK